MLPGHLRTEASLSTCRKRGFALIALALAIGALVLVIGLAVDVGRMYVAKSEAQTYADSASLAATLELDGTTEGIERARSKVAANPNRWKFQTTRFERTLIAFAKDAQGPWAATVQNAQGYRLARVVATAPVPLTFLGVLSQQSPVPHSPAAFWLLTAPKVDVVADSAAGQQPRTSFREGLFPFSPFAHSLTGPHFGLVPGTRYTLRWAASPRVNANVCPGDNVQRMVDLAGAGGGEERGFIESTSADLIRATIEDDFQTVVRSVGDTVFMSGGAKQTMVDSLVRRINQDTDPNSETYAQYVSGRLGNGRRIVGVPINTGAPDYRIVQIGAFLLLRAPEYSNGGNKPFCAEYLGAWLQGSSKKGAADAGAYVARLIK
jgi:hypothetical protein